ncbi:Helix-turn-helix domain-containing protein [Actinopolymorpha cephalotaxi]|uniref:DNA-binding transcriptional ArsR family regulator n=1 Tax=Actinopolymorpha cephalotaxi TaxID=504797 RepID=A0A1I2Z6E8_9ACTN|nr:helix-turn-helix domain-containing protein [Actinopolymorpha cephalotaxi]NYH81850.1 DNA-binding transcriptional ArsR family regulator [Actinopolymorpha cephalotaxi]SFH32601.1 Helix-turn-helix domain-containing protein [Actinopolymorpha cephalotaxi]
MARTAPSGRMPPARRPGGRRRSQITLEDPRAIRALSHPARLTVIDELYGGRVATSTELAELTGLTPSAMSYHLRALADLGIVERDESAAADGRARPWRAAARALNVASLATRAQRAAVTLLGGALLDAQRADLHAYVAGESTLPAEWRGKVGLDTGTAYLTAAETEQLLTALHAAAEPFQRLGRRRREGTRRVRTSLMVVPIVDQGGS